VHGRHRAVTASVVDEHEFPVLAPAAHCIAHGGDEGTHGFELVVERRDDGKQAEFEWERA
jgi:hypothetical protein